MIATLKQLIQAMVKHGATRIYAKQMSPNDNSKNQIYLATNYSALNFIPHGTWQQDDSQIPRVSKRTRLKAKLDFHWIGADRKHRAPGAQLILYPKYPEIRLSGILRNCPSSPKDLVNSRTPERLLLLGACPNRELLGYVAGPQEPLARDFAEKFAWPAPAVLAEIATAELQPSRIGLLKQLGKIHGRAWHDSVRLKKGKVERYDAQNGGGYTLEAALGISPNGLPFPDFLGWEIKQYGVTDFRSNKALSPITLMTPEPTGGLYKEQGVEVFLRKYGYAALSGQPDRINFGGIYRCGEGFHHRTGLELALDGYDASKRTITDFKSGSMALIDKKGNAAASWSLTSLMEHWVRKHAHAAFIPSLKRFAPHPQYSFGSQVLLCEEADFELLLSSIATGLVCYDPSTKLLHETAQQKKSTKRRNQFRVKFSDLQQLYKHSEWIDIKIHHAQ